MPRANNAQPPRTDFILIMLGRLMPTANSNGDAHLAWFARSETGICLCRNRQHTCVLSILSTKQRIVKQGSPCQNSKPRKLINEKLIN